MAKVRNLSGKRLLNRFASGNRLRYDRGLTAGSPRSAHPCHVCCYMRFG